MIESFLEITRKLRLIWKEKELIESHTMQNCNCGCNIINISFKYVQKKKKFELILHSAAKYFRDVYIGHSWKRAVKSESQAECLNDEVVGI